MEDWEYYFSSDAEAEANSLKTIWVSFQYIVRFYIGFFVMVAWVVIAIVCMATIIGFKFGLKAFRCSILMYKSNIDWREADVSSDFSSEPVKNGIWCCTVGAVMSLVHIAFGLWGFLTLVAIPNGISYFKSIKYIIAPFGAEIY